MGSPQEWSQGKDRLNEIAAHIHPTRDKVDEKEESDLKEDIIACSLTFPDIPSIPLQLDEFIPVVFSYASGGILFMAPDYSDRGK